MCVHADIYSVSGGKNWNNFSVYWWMKGRMSWHIYTHGILYSFLKKWVRAHSVALEKCSWCICWVKKSKWDSSVYNIQKTFVFQILWDWRKVWKHLLLIITDVQVMRCYLSSQSCIIFFPLIVEGTNCAGGLYKLIQKKNCLESNYKVDFW